MAGSEPFYFLLLLFFQPAPYGRRLRSNTNDVNFPTRRVSPVMRCKVLSLFELTRHAMFPPVNKMSRLLMSFTSLIHEAHQTKSPREKGILKLRDVVGLSIIIILSLHLLLLPTSP